tara:strand:- start:82 stop:522 length:441 start_codon:yes stop_codon:yes gene_type:complete
MTEPSAETMIKVVKEHFNFKIDEDAYSNYDIAAYTESTADGYEVYVVTSDMNSISIAEDVYYYESDVAQALIDEITGGGWGDTVVYADQYFLDEIYFDDALADLFLENIDDILADAEEEGYSLTVAELAWLKNEYSEEEETEETVS